jgi:hypothetical protein
MLLDLLLAPPLLPLTAEHRGSEPEAQLTALVLLLWLPPLLVA